MRYANLAKLPTETDSHWLGASGWLLNFLLTYFIPQLVDLLISMLMIFTVTFNTKKNKKNSMSDIPLGLTKGIRYYNTLHYQGKAAVMLGDEAFIISST